MSIYDLIAAMGFIDYCSGEILGKGFIKKATELYRSKRKTKQNLYAISQLELILQDYNSKKFLAQNPNHRTAALILESFRLVLIIPIFLIIFFLLIKELLIKIEGMVKLLDLNVQILPKSPFDIYVFSLLLIAIGTVFLSRIIFQNVAPLYHFKLFHELTISSLYKNLTLLDSSPKNLEAIKAIQETKLEDEFPESELSDQSFSFHRAIYNYPKIVEKEVNKNYRGTDQAKSNLETLIEKWATP